MNRSEAFITNAALCNPKDDDGNNANPNDKEIANCSSFLKRQIQIVDPVLIVTLGRAALDGLNAIEPHDFTLSKDVRTLVNWSGRALIPLYHPSPKAIRLHRNFMLQQEDYNFVADQRTLLLQNPPQP